MFSLRNQGGRIPGRGLLFAFCFLVSSNAWAYCRTTTCDPGARCSDDPKSCCVLNSDGCDENGTPISWPNSCVSYNLHEDGSKLREISAQELSDIVDDAMSQWLDVDCDGEQISLSVENRGLSSCGQIQYNEGPKDKNANVWMFRESGDLGGQSPGGNGPVDSRTLAVTTLSIDVNTGAIYGVDVELNSVLANFTTSDEDVVIDLASIVTHEAGHFLGLDHSREDAVMMPEYRPGDLSPRALKSDDEAGICAVYPQDRDIDEKTCEPHGKYSSECHSEGCGCHVIGGRSLPSPGSLWLGLGAIGVFFLRRRSATRS